MSGALKLRLAAFILAIFGMVGVIAWLAYNAWRREGDLRDKLTTVQLQSFQIAGHFQQAILGLNNQVLRYGAYRDTNAWTRFSVASKELDGWIDDQRPLLNTEKEKQFLDLINSAYDDYLGAAKQIGARASAQDLPQRLEDFAGFEAQSHRLLDLGIRLAGAHGESMASFLAESKKSLNYLRFMLLGSLALFLLAGAGLAVVIYRELIAPLRVKLIESQQLIERQEKLASLGLLAAGVAHEIRNPITAIKAWLFLQNKHLKPGSPEEEDAQIIADEVSRLEGIVRDVLLFARPSLPRLAPVTAGEIFKRVQVLLGPQLEKSSIRLEIEGPQSTQLKADAHQIQQVLMNLIQNAADSIGRDGTVTLRVSENVKRLGGRTEEVVILEVEDTGKGIAPEVEKRLFDPFFTTKETGTGLGLSIAARIVEKHGGALQYQSLPERGATFGVVLPKEGPEAS